MFADTEVEPVEEVVPAPIPEPETATISYCTVDLPVLFRGCKDYKVGYVNTLQILLKNYLDKSIVVDGDFGPLTEAAVNKYRAKHGLPQNGLVDNTVWQLLLQ